MTTTDRPPVTPLPCPFCGGAVTVEYSGSSDWVFDCGGCIASTTVWVRTAGDERLAAMKRWNRRAVPPPVTEEMVERGARHAYERVFVDGYWPDEPEAIKQEYRDEFRADLTAALSPPEPA